MKILFSPVGMTDPIRYFKDGALLNICRNHRPDKVYLYMSKEVLKFHDKDDRYRYCLERLGELLGHKFEIELIKRPELEDVQLFDAFLTDFRNELANIHAQYTDAEILLNVSSGTPAMKSSLQILSLTMNFHCLPVQVSTPQKSSNPRIDEEKDLTPEEHWELNESNDAEDDRCIASPAENLLEEFEKQSVKKLINSYDYAAAYAIAKDSEMFSDKFKELLSAASSRVKLETKAATVFNKYNIRGIFTNAKYKDFADIEEYLLLLKIKLIKEEYADFLRSITPAIFELFKMYLKNKCGFDIADHTTTDRFGVMKWDPKKLAGTSVLKILDNKYKKTGGLRTDSDVYSDALSELIVNTATDPAAKLIVDDLRNKVEKRLRNKAAHTIISITDDTVKSYTGMSSGEIFDKLTELLALCGYRLNEDLYDKMNDILISEI
ncbi:hypothetical protein [Ruminococcus sp.]|uniref:type III-A CRISPR-associated CARF protein Csm6 n=1 Tax=Ruminococcus sp. TaxID=41978 RepID=UPI0025ECACD0|nr:hypothetical protein [Ruminococcus sp.]MBQ9542713.1 hypothetical protein [Ruminococcus sp.]